MNQAPRKARGIALVTSLIFLVVITLLALSAMRGVGLQEQMASNLREKSRALDAAGTALRGREFTIFEWEEPLEADATGTYDVWLLGGPITDADASGFADDSIWGQALVYDEAPYDNNSTNGLTAQPKSYVELACFDQLLNGIGAVDAAKSTTPIVEHHRVTGRGEGGNETAVAIVQSIYASIFYDTDVVLVNTDRCFEP